MDHINLFDFNSTRRCNSNFNAYLTHQKDSDLMVYQLIFGFRHPIAEQFPTPSSRLRACHGPNSIEFEVCGERTRVSIKHSKQNLCVWLQPSPLTRMIDEENRRDSLVVLNLSLEHQR
ncbi:hypothetical protein ACOME3_010623 [Neoechinorhynchus agilis]